MDLLLDRTDPAHANIRAELSVALQALLRSAEYTSKDGKLKENNSTITRADTVEFTSERVVMMMATCTTRHHLAGKTPPHSDRGWWSIH